MENMQITWAKYVNVDNTNIAVEATIDGQEMSVPLDPANRHYAEILKQIEEGTLVVQPADEN